MQSITAVAFGLALDNFRQSGHTDINHVGYIHTVLTEE